MLERRQSTSRLRPSKLRALQHTSILSGQVIQIREASSSSSNQHLTDNAIGRESTISSHTVTYGILSFRSVDLFSPAEQCPNRQPLIKKLAPTMTLGLGVTTFMFVFTYLPQMAIMAFTSGPLAAISAALLVLSESSTLFTVLSKTFLIDDALVDTFDGVLISKNTTNLVSEGRQIKGGSGVMGKLGKLTKKPFQQFTPTAIIRYFMYLPLNFIPVVGTVMFVILQGKRAGPAAHQRYFQLKQWNSSQKQKHVEEYKAAYTRYTFYCIPGILKHLLMTVSFGVTAVLLELVPLASILFSFTNTTGAALWAADMEKGNVTAEGTAPQLREQVKKAE